MVIAQDKRVIKRGSLSQKVNAAAGHVEKREGMNPPAAPYRGRGSTK